MSLAEDREYVLSRPCRCASALFQELPAPLVIKSRFLMPSVKLAAPPLTLAASGTGRLEVCLPELRAGDLTKFQIEAGNSSSGLLSRTAQP